MKRPRSRSDMIEYLSGHFRYYTMHSWNRATSYAARIKIRHIGSGLPNDVVSRMYDCLEVREAFREPNSILGEFDQRHKYRRQIFYNGRSGGYLVLIPGGTKPSGYKSYCEDCGQKNCNPATEEKHQCGRCGADARVNFEEEDMEVYTQPGQGMDMEEDFKSWDTDSLRDRVALVWDFDQTCGKAVQAFIRFAETHEVVDDTILVPKDIKVAVSI